MTKHNLRAINIDTLNTLPKKSIEIRKEDPEFIQSIHKERKGEQPLTQEDFTLYTDLAAAYWSNLPNLTISQIDEKINGHTLYEQSTEDNEARALSILLFLHSYFPSELKHKSEIYQRITLNIAALLYLSNITLQDGRHYRDFINEFAKPKEAKNINQSRLNLGNSHSPQEQAKYLLFFSSMDN